MRSLLPILTAVALCSTIDAAPAKERSLSGTWCLASEELVITFHGTDSVRVSSTAEDGVNGVGSYAKQDTMFVATLSGDGLVIKMGYRYTWQSDSTIEARTMFITVDGDSVDAPTGALQMKRCATKGTAPQPAPAPNTSKKQSTSK